MYLLQVNIAYSCTNKSVLDFATRRKYAKQLMTALQLVAVGISNVPFHDYLKCNLVHTREGKILLKETIVRLNKTVKGGKQSVFQCLGMYMPNKDGIFIACCLFDI